MIEKQNTKLIFLGTPAFAATALERLISDGYHITAVITQPDKPSGRGQGVVYSAVKEIALKHNLPLYQPSNKTELTTILKGAATDVAVVAAYGMILSTEALSLAKYGFLNIHGSILPAYRGASPVTQAILDGLDTTGITIMKMDAGMDTGDIISKHELTIAADDTTESLMAKLALLGADAISEVLPKWLTGNLEAVKQDNNLASYCQKISKSDGEISWSEPAEMIERKIRAYQPWPKAFTEIAGKRCVILAAKILETSSLEPGQFTRIDKALVVGTSNHDLAILSLQPEGKKAQSGNEFANNFLK